MIGESMTLLPQRFLFHFAAPCYYRAPLWTPKIAPWDAKYRLVNLADLEGQAAATEVHAAWSEDGLAFRVPCVVASSAAVVPRSHAGRQRRRGLLDRYPRRAQRASRRVASVTASSFLPSGGNAAGQSPGPSRAHPPRPGEPQNDLRRAACSAGERQTDGYLLEALIPADALTGFEPAEHPRLGFTYAILDRELGEQTFGVGHPCPTRKTPAFWATLELLRE